MPKLKPPLGYESWLDFCVSRMPIAHAQSIFDIDSAYGEETPEPDEIIKAARDELEELRRKAGEA